jgi:NO-binding membrane sensor protein with MHYT domain
MSDFRKFTGVERSFMKLFIALTDRKAMLFTIAALFSPIFLFYFDVFEGEYLIPNTTDIFYSLNMIGVHIALCHFIGMYAVRLTQESITNILDFMHKKLAYENYKTIVERYGKEALK